MASITQRGPSSFRVLIRRKGEVSICRTFKTRAEAEAFAGASDQPEEVTILQAVEAYRRLRSESRRPIKRGGNEHYMLEHLVRDFGTERVSSLTPERLRVWATERAADGAGGYTLNMELSKLGTVLRYASVSMKTSLPDITREARPLLDHLHLIGQSESRERRLNPGEEERLLALAPKWMGDVVRFALSTAMRRGEIVRLLWSDLDEAKKLVMIRDRKHPRKKIGNHEWIPLLGVSYAVVMAQPRVSDRIFPYSEEKISDTFKLMVDAAEIKDLRFHDLRHEATSRLFDQGYRIEQVAIVTGHKDWRNLRRYTQIRPESLHDSLFAPDRPSKPRPESRPRAARSRAKSESGTASG